MNTPPPISLPRIALIDTLRGIALLGIIAIHSMAHFSCGNYPPFEEGWGKAVNVFSYDAACFLFDFKAFLLFSFLFGLSFFIQIDRAEKRGCDFRARFAWRLLLLGIFGLIDTAFFDGDILSIFAVAGFILLPLYKVRIKYLLIIAGVLLSFPLGIYNLIAEAWNPEFICSPSIHVSARNDANFQNMAYWNFTDGLARRFFLQIFAGRVWETMGLFILGMCAGKMRVFERPSEHQKLFAKVLAGGLITAICFYLVLQHPPLRYSWFKSLSSIYWCLGYTAAFVALITLCFRPPLAGPLTSIFAPVGKMSLTCYMTQSVFFTFLYAGWGLGMAAHMGYFYSTAAGIAFFGVQTICCSIWLRFFKYGPFEWLWRSCTMLKWQAFKK